MLVAWLPRLKKIVSRDERSNRILRDSKGQERLVLI